jgi:hypothetical protein
MNSKQMGLESVALALIFAPEPFTTLIGVGLLVAARASKVHNGSRRPTDRFEDYYRCAIELANDGKLKYRVAPTRDGQMPHSVQRRTNLYDTDGWEYYRKSAYRYLSDKNPEGDGKLPQTVTMRDKVYESDGWHQRRQESTGEVSTKKPYDVDGKMTQGITMTAKMYQTDGWQQSRQGGSGKAPAKKSSSFKGLQRGLLQDVNRGFNHKNY